MDSITALHSRADHFRIDFTGETKPGLVEDRRTKGGLMARRVFFSFHFANDFWRTQQVRNIGALEGQTLCTANAWEEVKRKGKASIEEWIDDNMYGKSCVVVLVGSETASRPWVVREIVKGWDAGKGVVGIRINKLLG
ncbi:TIR domain-containing protein, partial [Pseudomonas proteolytica]|uniref:TIR domain-containing protein n=1 Tax=Pseudomonas proteolytica TaxID=219574 RepID=UPI0030D77091